MKELFRRIANKVSTAAGHASTFLLAVLLIIVWALTGPIFDFSNTWQLVVNTGTTIITFLMVFLIQNTQNRDGKAVQLKLDELIRATRARDSFIDIEDLDDDELSQLAAEFSRIQKTENNAAFLKFHDKLQETLTKRRTLPGEDMANQVVNMLNPFSDGSKKPKK